MDACGFERPIDRIRATGMISFRISEKDVARPAVTTSTATLHTPSASGTTSSIVLHMLASERAAGIGPS